MEKLFSKMKRLFSWSPRKKGAASPHKRADAAVMAQRPPRLNDQAHFEVVRDSEAVSEAFADLRRYLMDATDIPPDPNQVLAKPLFREYGQLPGDRQYIYIQKAGEDGLLFEETTTGWIISRAEKIAARDLFLRRHTPTDIVTLYQKMDPVTGIVGRPRVQSPVLGQGYLPRTVYYQKLLDQLPLT